jgi:hypothetical protein
VRACVRACVGGRALGAGVCIYVDVHACLSVVVWELHIPDPFRFHPATPFHLQRSIRLTAVQWTHEFVRLAWESLLALSADLLGAHIRVRDTVG